MTPENLAVVICPNLLRAPNNNFGLIMKNMGPLTVLFKALIMHVRLSCYPVRIRVLNSKPTQMHYIFDEDVAEEGEEGEDVDEGDEEGDDDGLVHGDESTAGDALYVPEVDFGPRFTASPEPDELLQDTISYSPDR